MATLRNALRNPTWKKIEHWIVIAIIVFVIGGGTLAHIFADELNLMPNGDDSPAYTPDCYRC